MTEENNIPVEAPIVEEAPVVEEAVTEPVVEQEQVTEAQQDNIAIDFSDLAPPVVEAPQRPEPDLTDTIAQKILDKLTPKQEQPALNQSDEEIVTRAELQQVLAQIQEQQKAEKFVQETIAASKAVTDGYVTKLTDTLSKNGIDLNQDQSLKTACDLLYRQMFAQKVQQLGRIQPVLTPAETHELIQEHFKNFNNIFLANKIQKKSQSVNNLSPATKTVSSQNDSVKPVDEFNDFVRKKEDGSLTMSDITKILARPTQKK